MQTVNVFIFHDSALQIFGILCGASVQQVMGVSRSGSGFFLVFCISYRCGPCLNFLFCCPLHYLADLEGELFVVVADVVLFVN